MNYCSHCGAPVHTTIPAGDNRERHVCANCGTIHYQNPKIIAGCLPVWGEQVLLCRRAIEPRAGFWTLPAGFMEQGETLVEAAMRETAEEANAQVAVDELQCVFTLPHMSQIHVIFRARLLSTAFYPGHESLETRLFEEHEIPWPDLAFETIRRALRHYYADRSEGRFLTRVEDIIRTAR